MSAKQIDLRGLTDAERDAKVSNAVAEHCAGYRWWHLNNFNEATLFRPGHIASTMWGRPIETEGDGNAASLHSTAPGYATSADAVLPLLEKWRSSICIRGVTGWTLRLFAQPSDGAAFLGANEIAHAYAPTFPLAACYALLLAHGYEVLT